MEPFKKIDEWVKLHAPMLAGVYENKYVGMLYDRFGSLPSKRQRQVVLGVFGGIGLVVFLILFSTYLTYWSYSSGARNARVMSNMLTQYQQNVKSKEGQIAQLEQNNRLAAPDALKQHILEQGKLANISPRMMKAEEKPDATAGESRGASEVRIKAASVKLERINLTQLRSFLHNVEYGPYSLAVASIAISNDDKIRGYMNVELGIVAYLFASEGEMPS